MAMATVAASVVQGEAVVPRLLPDADPAEASPEEPLTGGEAAALRDLMRAVVTEGSATFLSAVPGPADRRQDRHRGVRQRRPAARRTPG